jgi:hypothetical protein
MSAVVPNVAHQGLASREGNPLRGYYKDKLSHAQMVAVTASTTTPEGGLYGAGHPGWLRQDVA